LATLPILKGRQVVAALQRGGFVIVSTKKHVKLRGPKGHIVMVPNHPGKDILPATLEAIVTQSGLTEDEFRQLL
jgi:predicted RNA binding protein YcfA (HicA-like mRNA interferase family)